MTHLRGLGLLGIAFGNSSGVSSWIPTSFVRCLFLGFGRSSTEVSNCVICAGVVVSFRGFVGCGGSWE